MHWTSWCLGLLLIGVNDLTLRSEPVPARPRAAVWSADVPGGDPAFARDLAGVIEAAGYRLEFLDSTALTNVTRVNTNSCDLLVLPDARILPVESVGAVQGFLRDGGNLLALGLTAWATPTFRLAGQWWSQAGYDAALAACKPQRSLMDFAEQDVTRWTRHAFNPAVSAAREVVQEGGAAALHVRLQGLDGWDTLEPPARPWVLSPGQTVTCFRAKGTAATRQLAVEWVERDGSRWIATVDLAPEWRSFVLPAAAFHPWQPPPGRGAIGDQLNVTNMARFTVGLAVSHTAVGAGPQEYWFADLGTAPSPFGNAMPPTATTVPRLESFSPAYQCYPITTPVSIRPRQWQTWIRDSGSTNRMPTATNDVVQAGPGLLALHPRPQAAGFNQERGWRWQPLLSARDVATVDYRGAVGALVAQFEPPGRSGLWALFTPADAAFYRQEQVKGWLRQVVRRMRDGVMLAEGGSEFFTVFEHQPVRLGARVVNLGRAPATNLTVLLTVVEQQHSAAVYRHRQEVVLPPGGQTVVEAVWNPTNWPAGGCTVAAQLLAGGRVVDELFHELNCWQPPPTPAFVEARDGGLWQAGQPWKAHGVNYMPSSGIGVTSEAFEYWLGRGAYDPEVVERDLRRVKTMGLSAVSAFIYRRDLGAQHLLDFLFRCERLGLKVNLSLRPGTPMEFRWEEMKELIEHYQLAQNDTVMAYDLAWEPSHFDHAYQEQHYARAWPDWLLRRYGSLEAAGRAWQGGAAGFVLPAGQLAAIPPMAQFLADGPWRRRIADYRAFLDELLHERYAEARRLVRSVDPHHPVSFRMQLAGDPTFQSENLLPYDFWGLAGAVDLWEPEAYGRIGDWDRVKAGEFTAAYARLCDPGKPLVWAEMGCSVWDLSTGGPASAKLEFAAQFYRDFYRVLRESGADGIFFWWYPGGFRVNEQSDFGILNPDGTDRAVTRVIREEGARFLAAPKPPAPTRSWRVDRDRDARGLFGIYEAVKGDYWRARAAGENVGLTWQSVPGAKPE